MKGFTRRTAPRRSPRRYCRWLLAGLTSGVVASSVMVAVPAAAAAPVSWSACLLNSRASVSFASPSVNWLGTDKATWSATIGANCPADTTASLVEETVQQNEAAQTFALGTQTSGNIQVGAPTVLSGSTTVTPLRSLGWGITLTSPSTNNRVVLGSPAPVTVVQPTGPLSGAPKSVEITGNTAQDKMDFAHGVQTPGIEIRVADGVNLDVSGLVNLPVAENVQILGGAASRPNAGRLFTRTFPSTLLFVNNGSATSHERISGLRIDGLAPANATDNLGDDDANAIVTVKPNVEVDHNEIYSWRGAGVEVSDPRGLIDRNNASSVWIHDNYIHDDQHPTGDLVGGGHGEGYGVETANGATALIERNVFDGNRHAVAGDGRPGTGYFFDRNLILPRGGVNTSLDHTHIIDMHGRDDCGVFGSFNCGAAGEFMDVQYNTVEYTGEYDVKLRGTPSVSMDIGNNVFSRGSQSDAIAFTEVSPRILPGNSYGFNPAANTVTTADFDGDGVNDPFLASGQTWWYKSSRLGGRWVYLNQVGATGSAVKLGDVDGDGLADATVGNRTYTTPALPTASAVTGDFNMDGKTDVAELGRTDGIVTAHLSNGDGSFATVNHTNPALASAANTPGVTPVTGDFNGDGQTDIALIGGADATTVPVALSLGNGTFSLVSSDAGLFPGWSRTDNVQALAGDFNNDKKTDIALIGGGPWTSIPVAFSDGDGTFTVTNTAIAGFGPLAAALGTHAVVGDFNKDGRTDIALTPGVGNPANLTTIPTALSNGDGSFKFVNGAGGQIPGWAQTPNVQTLAGDFNNDGRTDFALIGGGPWTSIPIAFSNGDGTFNATNTAVAVFGPIAARPRTHAVVEDVNHDGKADITLTPGPGNPGWTTMPSARSNGNGGFDTANSDGGLFPAWSQDTGVHTLGGDFDGDGKGDVALFGRAGWTSIPVAFAHGDGTYFVTNRAL
ncbi:FG-GAP repeat domain-containing protein [Actinacidiphila bryophytorum]|uniref:FG-GAP repeat domain-containing protein n=1 Tax=Actinacidiphila bryophytorum TaxID=1436133 RepID=UPI0021769B29|nr:VCBS repeat-containing protein [Actinacidiphila bryophytorum]UWE08373.1 VCBS repeat-containing protein [Actinacidiphila bryophytorum]